jgi:hypothetical protein
MELKPSPHQAVQAMIVADKPKSLSEAILTTLRIRIDGTKST